MIDEADARRMTNNLNRANKADPSILYKYANYSEVY